ncbi:MAG: hypothetical protein GY697_23615, partial [Desulfobacterales bacterium]|nr:hypothetical protein [Desulfobacterales bacterium]
PYLEGAESYTITIDSITGGGFENIEAESGADSVTTTITDGAVEVDGGVGAADTALVSISGDTAITEGETAAYTVSVDETPTSDITVNFTYTGVAADGTDFTGVSSVTIPANSSSAPVNVASIDDPYLEGAESYTITIDSITGGGFENIEAESGSDSVTTTITDGAAEVDGGIGADDTALVSITGDTAITEGETASYTVSVDETPTSDVTVNFTYTGVAVDGTDFTGVSSVTIPASSTSAPVNVASIDDPYLEGAESYTITIDSITGGGFENIETEPGADSVTTTITDGAVEVDGGIGADDTALVSITGDTAITEGETAAYTVSVDETPTSDVTV